MSIVAFIIGILLTTVCGFLAVSIAEGRTKVLGHMERLAWSLALGPTVAMFAVFLSHIGGLTSLNRTGFLIPIIGTITILTIIGWMTQSLRFGSATSHFAERKKHPTWMIAGIGILCVWTSIKILAGAYDLVSVPTYWDDSFNNWNMRGKMFFVTEELRLEIPAGNGVMTEAGSVSSYPVTLPLMKTFVSVLYGEWSEPLVNGVQLVWFAGLILGFFMMLRRSFDPLLSAFGVYLLVSLPLVIIHGVNPYAEIFVASHVFFAASAVRGLSRSQESDVGSWIRLLGLTLGLLVLTKNEALVLHAPLLALTVCIFSRRKLLEHKKILTLSIGIGLMFVVPWLIFKVSNGLTFGNAKAVSGVSLSFNKTVISAIWFHLTHEPNWLLLPIALPIALVFAGTKFWRSPEASIAVFVLLGILAQFVLLAMIPALSTEAINQTGISRGLLHLMPIAILALLYATKESFNND